MFPDVLHDVHPVAVDSVVFVPCFEKVLSYHCSLVAIVVSNVGPNSLGGRVLCGWEVSRRASRLSLSSCLHRLVQPCVDVESSRISPIAALLSTLLQIYSMSSLVFVLSKVVSIRLVPSRESSSCPRSPESPCCPESVAIVKPVLRSYSQTCRYPLFTVCTTYSTNPCTTD